VIDTEVIPAIDAVAVVRDAQAYNSINGEVTFVLDIQDMATVDRILLDPRLKAVLGKLWNMLSPTGGEVPYDRVRWQELYAGSKADGVCLRPS
jgi:hypothetical protein